MESIGETNTPSVPEFAKWLETEHPKLFLYFLTVLALNEHLARFVSSSPLGTVDPITRDVRTLIKHRYPQLDTKAAADFRIALEQYLRESGAIQAHFEYTPPPPR